MSTEVQNLIQKLIKLVFPIHSTNHWIVGIFFVNEFKLEIWDSLNSKEHFNYAQNVINKLLNEIFKEKQNITIEYFPKAAEQKDGFSCGIFLLHYMESRINNKFPESININEKREQVCELFKNKFKDTQNDWVFKIKFK